MWGLLFCFMQVQPECETIFLEAHSSSVALIGQWLEIKGHKMGVVAISSRQTSLLPDSL